MTASFPSLPPRLNRSLIHTWFGHNRSFDRELTSEEELAKLNNRSDGRHLFPGLFPGCRSLSEGAREVTLVCSANSKRTFMPRLVKSLADMNNTDPAPMTDWSSLLLRGLLHLREKTAAWPRGKGG
jgi:hypothetical protein